MAEEKQCIPYGKEHDDEGQCKLSTRCLQGRRGKRHFPYAFAETRGQGEGARNHRRHGGPHRSDPAFDEHPRRTRDSEAHLRIQQSCVEYLFPSAGKPKELEDFKGVNGQNHQAPATPADLFLHVRAGEASTTYLVVDQIMGFLRPVVDVVDETHGFHYREGRAIIDFIDGTENPVGEEAKEWAIIGEEDPDFINGSYAFAQKYVHDLDAWRALPTEVQEKYIGRR